MKYKTIEEGEWITPIMKGYKMMCCDCQLVHTVDFRVVPLGVKKHKIMMRVFRNERATSAARRKKNAI